MDSIVIQTKLAMILILVALVQAWLVVARRYLGVALLQRWIRADQDLIRSHIDFILMALLLFAFSRVDSQPAPILVWLSCAGAVANPILFAILSVHPEVSRSPLSPFGMFSALSFSVTTVGFGGRALLFVLA